MLKYNFIRNCEVLSELGDNFLRTSHYGLGDAYPYDIVYLDCVKDWYRSIRDNGDKYRLFGPEKTAPLIGGLDYVYEKSI